VLDALLPGGLSPTFSASTVVLPPFGVNVAFQLLALPVIS
jgi:hypothetical protein